MQKWVDDVIKKHSIKKVLAFSSPVAQFVMDKNIHKLMDFIDIDSDKWKQYSASHQGIMSWVYAREAKKLFQYEKQIAQEFNTSFFVSDKEAEHFRKLLKQEESNNNDEVFGISNGIDFDFFNPNREYKNPYKTTNKKLIFTGAMDYWANVDAVIWFASKVFKPLYKHDNSFEFIIVGGNPTKEVQALEKIKGVYVTGRVKDVRPYIHYAYMAVAPLRITRGIQNKVLEAMAMNKVVVTTKNAMEGIKINKDIGQFVTDDAKKQLKLILKHSQMIKLEDNGKKFGDWIREHYQWENVLMPLKKLIDKI